MFKGIKNPAKRWELRMEILLCLLTFGLYLGFGCIANMYYGTGQKPLPYTYAWTFTSSTLNNTVTTTQRHTQPIVIAPTGEENYASFEGWFTIFPTCLLAVVGALKFGAAWSESDDEYFPNAVVPGASAKYDPMAASAVDSISNVVPGSVQYEPPKRSNVYQDASAMENGFKAATDSAFEPNAGDKDYSSKKARNSARGRYGTLFLPMYATTGVIYMVAGAMWFPVIMYHFGHDSVTAKYMFAAGSVIMGAALITVEGATHLVWSGKTKSNYSISMVAWICFLLSAFLTCVTGATLGNVITNQETVWNNPLTGSDAAFTSVTAYPLAAVTRFLYSTNTLEFYNALVDAKALVYYYYCVQAIRVIRLGSLLVMELFATDNNTSVKSKRGYWETQIAGAISAIVYLALYAEPLIVAGFICHGDFSIISGQFKIPPGRTKVL